MENQDQIIQNLKRNVDLLFAATRSSRNKKANAGELKDYAEQMSKSSDDLLNYTTTAVDNLLLCDIRAIFPGLSYNPAPEPWTKTKVKVNLPKIVKQSLDSSWRGLGFPWGGGFPMDTLFIHVQQAISVPRMKSDAIETLYLEKSPALRYASTTKGHRWYLYGAPDYVLCSGSGASKIQHLVVLDKPRLMKEIAKSQVLAYMGMIHTDLKSRRKHDCTVYGLSTAPSELWFYQIDPQGKWSQTCYHVQKTDVQTFINLFAYILKKSSATALENIIPDGHTLSDDEFAECDSFVEIDD